MKVGLEMLASTCIRCRKPWPRIVWLGKEKESLFLLDNNRIGVLYVPSGKTKRNVQKLSSILPQTVCLAPTSDGLYLVGVQSSGELFVWNKDRDELKTIVGLASLLVEGDITPRADGCQVFPSKDCSHLLLVLASRHVFLWQREAHTNDCKNNTLLGKWVRVRSSSSVEMPSVDCMEVSMHAVFTYTQAFGDCCQLSMVFNQRGQLYVTSLLIQFNSELTPSQQTSVSPPATMWTYFSKPLSGLQPDWEPISLKGAYTCQYSHDGQILAVGVNQKSPAHTSVVFLSTFTKAMLLSDLKGCGLKNPGSKRGRQYWICDMAWTSDNLFLVIMLRNGSAAMLSRLCNPLVIFSKGSSLELGPAYFLTFSPLITVQSDKKQDTANSTAVPELDSMHQRFCVTTHPSLPIVLFSDGLIVTIAQLPTELNPMIFMRDLVLESSSYLRQVAETHRLDLTLPNAYNLPAGDLEGVKVSAHKHMRSEASDEYHYSFEEASSNLNETQDSVSFALGTPDPGNCHMGIIQNMSSGKIMFGEQDLSMLNRSFLDEPDSTLKTLQLAQANLFTVWKIAASSSEQWSANLDKILNHAVHNIVKFFSLVLDCAQIRDLLDEAATQFTQSSVHTTSLFKVVSLYRQLLDLLHFDCLQRHLLAHTFQLSNKTLQTILSSAGLSQVDPRIKTLTGCFTLLQFTEKSLLDVYISLPRTLGSVAESVKTGTEEEKKLSPGADGNFQAGHELAKRLTSTWKLLYKSVIQFIDSDEMTTADVGRAQALKSAIEQHLIELDVDIPRVPAANINNGERLSLDGKHTLAVDAWKDQLKQYRENGSMKNASQLFHSLLYTYILRNDFVAAIAFVDDLIVKANPSLAADLEPRQKMSSQDLKASVLTVVASTLRTQAMHDPDMMPCIRDKTVRQVVQSMARFMAAYFSNSMIFIFPPHNPAPLPPVHFETKDTNSRVVPKYHEDIAAIVRHQKLGSVWTVDRALEYLLLSGLVCEAAWFADRIGDWKAAYQLSVARLLHQQVAPAVYERHKRPLTLPDSLMPDSIMKRKLEVLMKDDWKLMNESSDLTYLTLVLKDISLSGIIGSFEVGPWLLEQLVAKLKSVVRQLPPLVTKDFYLPAPPLFLPQPAVGDQGHNSQEAAEETVQREKASSIIRLALCVMKAANLSLAATHWYVCALSEAQKKAFQFKAIIEAPCVDLPDVLYQYTEMDNSQVLFPQVSDDQSVLIVQSSFRDLCSVVWLLHVRDKLSLALRSREKFLKLELDVDNSEQWLRECFLTLQWAVHMVTFSHFLSDEASIYKVVLSLLLDFPATEDVAGVLAECMYDLENLHPEVQERLDRLLNTWQRIILAPEAGIKPTGGREDGGDYRSTLFQPGSPRGKSLSVYYHQQCLAMSKIIQKKRRCFGSYEEFVFTEIGDGSGKPSPKPNIGSRPFETKRLYVEFLDTFVSISFSHDLESGSDKNRSSNLPMLQVFSKDIINREMMSFVEGKSRSAQKNQQGLSVFSGASQALARASSQERLPSPSRKNPGTLNRPIPGRGYGREMMKITGDRGQNKPTGTSGGLFRGMSMVDPQSERSYTPVRRYESEPVLDDLDSFEGSEARPSPDVSRRKQSLTEFTSSFWRSEENLHPGSGRKDQGKPLWSLTVSFGKKYSVLQQTVEWLELWSSKSHSLAVSGHDKILDIAPKIKIHLPAQLIVLALWLLEHKYSSSSTERPGREKSPHSRRSARLSKSSLQFQTSDSAQRSTSGHSKKSATQKSGCLQKQEAAEEVPVQEKPSYSVKLEEETRSWNAQPLGLSGPPATLEPDEIINAYTNLLDEHEESSSIDVSSLASDELDGNLKTTLNAIRRTSSDSLLKENSALNLTLLPRDNTEGPGSNPQQPKDWSTHANQHLVDADSPRHRSTHSQTDKNTNHPKSKPTSADLPNQARSEEDLGVGIATQLQGVIRDELRKIMEAQHRSVLAMMGALDGKSPCDYTPALPQTSSSVVQSVSQKQATSQKQSKKHSQHTGTSSKQQNPGRQKETGLVDDVSGAESVSAQAYESLVLDQAHRRQGHKGEPMREALVELQNLQQATQQHPLATRYQQPSQSEHIGASIKNVFLSYPGPQGGNHVRLPFLPLHAWPEPSKQQQPPFPGFGTPRLPLLHINKSPAAEDAFTNLRRFLQQVPPLHTPQLQPNQVYKTQPMQQFFPPPPTPTAPSPFSLLAQPSQMFSRPNNEQPLPLLSVSAGEKPLSGFPFLRLLSAGSSFVSSEAALDNMKQKEKIEQTRQKLLRQFHEQVLQDKENAGQQVLAHQMLHMDTQDELSARSEKSHTSLRSQVDTVDSQPAEGQGRPSSVQEQSGVEVTDASTNDRHIRHGFALPRGVFDSYLQLGEQLIGPEANETNAAFQLKMALAMQRQLEKKIRSKVDFSTMTQEQVDAVMATDPSMEVIRTAEAATSITRDTGVDPVQEVVNEYNLKRHNNLIPPDIFMGLRFGDLDAQSGVEPAAPSSAPGKGRSYLNVVDIRASSVLRDIPERTERPEPLLDQDHLDMAVLSSERTLQQIGTLEETLRQKFAPRLTRTPGHGYDAVTVKVFDQLQPPANDRVSVAVLPRSSLSQPKAAVIRRLQDMSHQLKAIDEMSQNIERDFQSSHLLLQTIQEINDSVQRSRSSSPVRTRGQKSQMELGYFMDEEKEMRYSMDEEGEEKTSRQNSPDLPAPKTSAESPQVSAGSRAAVDSRSRDRLTEPDNELTKLIAEVLVQEGVDLQTAGFSQEMAELLERDARKQIRKSSEAVSSDLKDKLVNMKQADEHVKSRTPKEREQLKAWMTQKFHQRQAEYMKRRNELIQREPKPFRSQTTVTKADLKHLEERSEKRISMVSEFMNQRLVDAEHLLGSIIVDRPEVPWGSVSSVDTRRRNQSRSPARPDSSTSPPRLGASRRSRSPGRGRVIEATWTLKTTPASRSTYGTDISKMSRETASVKHILKSKDPRPSSADMFTGHHILTSISEGDQTLGSSTELMNYARQVLENDSSEKLSPLASYESIPDPMAAAPPVSQHRSSQAAGGAQSPRVRSLAHMVRMQRPEATRKWGAVNKQRRQQGESEKQSAYQEVLARSAAAQNPNLLKDKAKEYGSKQIPGFSPRQAAGPRRVKTYSERLQEMKPTRPYLPPAGRPISSVHTPSTRTFQTSARTGPAHKPQTYVEQLQNLRSKAPAQAKPADTKTPALMRTFLKAHGPRHRPKTYAEQLQELNPHPHRDVQQKKLMQSTVTLHGPYRAKTRSRPYSDPYSDMDYEELASVLSDWDVDENIRNIIYGGFTPSSSANFVPMNELELSLSGGDNPHAAPSYSQSDYFSTVMEGRNHYRLPGAGNEFGHGDYRSSVDIQEIERIAELASVRSDSILSVIDWEAVESLIKDV